MYVKPEITWQMVASEAWWKTRRNHSKDLLRQPDGPAAQFRAFPHRHKLLRTGWSPTQPVRLLRTKLVTRSAPRPMKDPRTTSRSSACVRFLNGLAHETTLHAIHAVFPPAFPKGKLKTEDKRWKP